MKTVRQNLINTRTKEVLAGTLEAADGFFSRFAGLQLRAPLERGRALALVPCASVHTFFMRFDLDLAMVDRSGRVLAVRRGVRPWRMVIAPSQTFAVIEFTSGFLPELEPGDRLVLDGGEPASLPRSLRFLTKEA